MRNISFQSFQRDASIPISHLARSEKSTIGKIWNVKAVKSKDSKRQKKANISCWECPLSQKHFVFDGLYPFYGISSLFFRRMRRAGRSTVRWMSSGSTCRSTSWKTSWSGRSRSARPSTTSCSRHSTTWSRTIEVLLPLFYHSTWNTSLLHRQLYSWVISKHIWDDKILYSI